VDENGTSRQDSVFCEVDAKSARLHIKLAYASLARAYKARAAHAQNQLPAALPAGPYAHQYVYLDFQGNHVAFADISPGRRWACSPATVGRVGEKCCPRWCWRPSGPVMRRREILERRVPPVLVWALAILALTFAGQWLQSRVHLNHDVSYFVHFARWLLQGRALGSDLLDMNLPMVWVLFMPAAALVQSNLLDEPLAVHLVFWIYFLISVALLIGVLSRLESRDRAASIGWIVAFALVATLAPGFSFGQREHASVLFAMPYLAAAVLRLQGAQDLRKSVAVSIGLLAGIGFAMKPYFLAVPVLVELLLLARLGWRSLLVRVESLVLGLTVLAYVVTVGLLIPDYLKFTIELTRSFYWAYDSGSFSAIVERYKIVAQPALYGVLIALLTRTWTRQHTVMLLAGLGYTVSYFVQSKGFVYHAYPVLVCAVAFLGVCLAQGVTRAWVGWRESGSSFRFALVPAVLVLALPPVKQVHDGVVRWYFTYNIAWGSTGQFRQAVIDTVNHFAPTPQSYFFAFTTHPFPGFPTASYTAAEWSGRAITQSIIPAFARLDEVADPALRDKVIRAAEFQRRIVVEDFERRPPSIVFAERNRARLGMNGRQFDDVSFYLRDPRFQRIWKNYEEFQPMGPLRVFVLRVDYPRAR